MKSLSRYIKERYKRIYIKRELYERLKALADNERVTVPDLIARMYERYIQPNISHNIITNIQPNIATSHNITPNIQSAPQTAERRSGHVWCRKRASIRNVEAFVKWVEKTYGLIDWWESEGEVCFETEKPAR